MARVVGMDLGSTGIRLVEIERTRAGLKVYKAAVVQIPPGAISGGLVRQPQIVAHLLKAAWKKHKFTTKRVALAVAGMDNDIVMREATIRYSPDPEVADALARAEHLVLPVAADDLYLSHLTLDTFPAPTTADPARVDAHIMLMGAAKTLVDPLAEVLEQAGLLPVGIDSAAVALVRSLTTTNAPDDECEFVVHVGDRSGFIVAAISGQPRKLTTLSEHSGHNLTKSIHDLAATDEIDAEEKKIEASEAVAVNLPHDLAPIIGAASSDLSAAIKTFVRGFEQESGTKATQVWLTGGAGSVGNLAAQFYAETFIPATETRATGWVSNPVKIETADNIQDMLIAVAAGDLH